MEEKRSEKLGREAEQNRPPSIVEGSTNYHPEGKRNAQMEGNMSQYGWQPKSARESNEKNASGKMADEEMTREGSRESPSRSSRQMRSTESVVICGRVEEASCGDSEWTCVAAEWETGGKDESEDALKRQQQATKRDMDNR